LPASGKSTRGTRLAADLELPLIDKDTILESLFNQQVEALDVQPRAQLSRAADRVLEDRANTLNVAVLVSWWRRPRSSQSSGTPIDWLKSAGTRCVEVLVTCPPELAVHRFLNRQRHPGHFDGRWSDAALHAEFAAQQLLGPPWVGACDQRGQQRQLKV
jgi:hypothetical protein